MKPLIFIVEGETELEFINRLVIPYLIGKDLNTFMQGIIIKMSGGGHGYNNIQHFLNTIRPVIYRSDEPVITSVYSIKAYPDFIPYIQRHELETLLFADPKSGFDLEDEAIKQDVLQLSKSFHSIEDINCTPEGAPSKRLKKIYSNHQRRYEKVSDAVDIAELTTLEVIMDKCPRFRKWIDILISKYAALL